MQIMKKLFYLCMLFSAISMVSCLGGGSDDFPDEPQHDDPNKPLEFKKYEKNIQLPEVTNCLKLDSGQTPPIRPFMPKKQINNIE